MNTGPSTHPHVVLVVVGAVSLIVFAGFAGTYELIMNKADASLVAVFSGLTGTALGGLMSMLNNTRTHPSSDNPTPPGGGDQSQPPKPQ